MFRDLRTAVGFLTILPVSPRRMEPEDLGNSVKFFPLAGAIYGAVTWGLLMLFQKIFNPEIAAWATVFLVAVFNGCIHWDGFADTADGLGGSTPERRLAIMKDSRLGAFGGIALIFLILGKIFTISKLTNLPLVTFMSVSALSRWVMAVQITTQPVVSQGLLKSFQLSHPRRDLLIATILMAVVVGFAFPTSLILSGVAFITCFILNWVYQRKFGGITGDLLGAGNELVELVCWLSLNINGW
jgi:adenosylcobinamide-GDP ribazoletransferase